MYKIIKINKLEAKEYSFQRLMAKWWLEKPPLM